MFWSIKPSLNAVKSVNPIRNIVDKLDFKNLPKGKDIISLSIGDPTKYGNLPVPTNVVKTLIKIIKEGNSNGYQTSFGNQIAREKIAQKYSLKGRRFSSQDVFISSGCSDAINMSLCSLLNEGDNILLPAPGFSLYTTICGRYGFQTKYYCLKPEKKWEIDLKHLESLIDEKTKCILVNNPSNPCGSSYSKKHLKNICDIAYKYHIPIIADEIYANIVFENENFISCCDVTQGPVFVLGGLSKQFLVPGWRVGWIVLHDPENRLLKIRHALVSLSQIILGANSLCQIAIPEIFEKTPSSFYKELNNKLGQAATLLYNGFKEIKGLKPVKPQGAMYLMVEIILDKFSDSIQDDVSFSSLLLKEEAVAVLPGKIFRSPNFFRVVLCIPSEKIFIALERIKNFCESNYRK